MGDGVILFDKSQKNEAGPLPDLQYPHTENAIDKGEWNPSPVCLSEIMELELIGNRGIEKKKSYAIRYLPTMQKQNTLLP